MKTPEEIDRLKRSWRADPCWDIEATLGFEDHRFELREYRLEMEAKVQLEAEEEALTLAYQAGLPNNARFGFWKRHLESQIEKMTGLLKKLEYEISELRAKIEMQKTDQRERKPEDYL